MRYRRQLLLAFAALAAVCAPCGRVRAAADGAASLLAPDTDWVVVINVRQFIDSELFKKHLRLPAEEALKAPDPKQFLKTMGLDVLSDLDRITIAGVNVGRRKTTNQVLLTFSGRFDVKKVTAYLETSSQKTREGRHTLWKQKDFYFTLADDKRFLAGTDPKLLAGALERAAAGKPRPLKNKQIAEALADVDKRTTVYLYSVGGLPTFGIPGASFENPGVAKVFEKVVAVKIDLRVTDGVRLTTTVNMRDGDAAKDVKRFVDPFIMLVKTRQLESVVSGTGSQPQKALLAALRLLDVGIRSLKSRAKGTDWVLNGEITAKEIEAVIKGLEDKP